MKRETFEKLLADTQSHSDRVGRELVCMRIDLILWRLKCEADAERLCTRALNGTIQAKFQI